MTAPAAESTAAVVALSAAEQRAQSFVQAETALLGRVSGNLLTALMRLWTSFHAYYNDAQVAAFAASAAKLVIAAQKATGQVTEQSLRRQLSAQGLRLPSGKFVDLPADLRLGATTADVYQRPVREVRYLTSLLEPAVREPTAEAISGGEDRLRRMVDTDLQLAKTTAAQQVMYAVPQVLGFRRIIHPEISGQVCGLCIVASDRVYKREALLPIHPGCHCTVLPVRDDNDPGRAINAADLTRIYGAAGSTRAEDLRRTRVTVSEHGELGPILTPSDAPQRGKRDVESNSSDRAIEARQRTLKAQRDDLDAQLRGRQVSTAQEAWMSDRIATLDRLIAAN